MNNYSFLRKFIVLNIYCAQDLATT